jgi:hypothetical protein
VNTSSVADRAAPGEPPRLVMDIMARSGFDVRRPEREEGRMTIACPGARCSLPVSDQGCAVWEYCPWPPGRRDRGLTADLATALLTGRPGPYPRQARRHEDITLKGIVGLELKTRGPDVDLAVLGGGRDDGEDDLR